MARKPEAGSAERSKSVSLPLRESYPLKEVVAAWKDYLDEERIVEYIKLGKLTCGVLLGDRPVKVINPSYVPGRRSYGVISEKGYYRLAPADAVSAYYRRGHRHAPTGRRFVEHVTEEDQKIILERPPAPDESCA